MNTFLNVLNKEVNLDKTKNLKFGVIGVGRIGKIHIENLAHRIPGNQVTAVADVFEDELKNVARQYNISLAVQDYKEIIENPEIDAVIICSPTDTHSQIIQESAVAGKHVFCEKPVDLSLEKIAKTIKATEDAGVKFQVGFNRRFEILIWRAILWIRRWLRFIPVDRFLLILFLSRQEMWIQL